MKSKIYLLLFIFCVSYAHSGTSQNILKEGFNSSSLPSGWGRVVTFDPVLDVFNWEFLNSADGHSPHSGSDMAVLISSPVLLAYDQAYLCTYSLDFSKDTTGNIKATFWMFRDTGTRDSSKIDMYVSTSAYPWMGTTAYLGTLWVADSPVVSSPGWYQYTFPIPDSFKGSSNYLIWWGTSDTAHSKLIDDVSIDQYSADTLKILHPEQDTLVCMGGPLDVPYGANHLFNIGNVFKVELSDSSGSFSSPTVIGTDTTNTLDVIHCTLPSVMSTTKAYKIRIVSTSPAETSPNDSYDIHATPALNGSFSESTNSPVCYGDSLKLTASTTDAGVSYQWTGPYHFVSNNPDTSLLFNHAGAYILYMTISRNGCNSVSNYALISINSTHPTSLTDSSNSPVCAGSTLRLYSNSATAGSSFIWSGPDTFSSTARNPTISNIGVKDTGKYYVYAVFNSCKSPVDSIDIQIKPQPSVPSDSSNGPICVGSPLKLYSSDSTTGVQFIWSGPGSFRDTEQNPVITTSTFRDTGKFYVFATLSTCNSAKDSIQVGIKHLPATPSDSSNGPVCLGSELKLFSKDDTSGVTYSWTGPDSFASSVQNPTIATTTLKSSGFYYVVTEKNGCLSDVDSINVKVKPLPANPSDSSNSPVCLGSKLELFSKDDTSGVTYSWTGPDSFTSSVQNPTITATIAKDSGFYYVVAEKNGCMSSIDSIHVSIDSVIIPTVKISVSPDTLVSAGATVTFTATVTGGGTSPTYKWLKNNVVIPGATTNTYVTNTLADKDVITAVVQSDAMCAMPDTAMSNTIRIRIIPTDVYSLDNGSDITLYPNPNNGSFIIKGSIRNTTSDKVSVEILNMVGQIIYSNTIPLQNGTLNSRIDLNSSIANGVYLLRLKTDQQEDIMRFTLQR